MKYIGNIISRLMERRRRNKILKMKKQIWYECFIQNEDGYGEFVDIKRISNNEILYRKQADTNQLVYSENNISYIIPEYIVYPGQYDNFIEYEAIEVIGKSVNKKELFVQRV